MNPFISLGTDPAMPYAVGFVFAVLIALLVWAFTRSEK
jgi:hypothetical protein